VGGTSNNKIEIEERGETTTTSVGKLVNESSNNNKQQQQRHLLLNERNYEVYNLQLLDQAAATTDDEHDDLELGCLDLRDAGEQQQQRVGGIDLASPLLGLNFDQLEPQFAVGPRGREALLDDHQEVNPDDLQGLNVRIEGNHHRFEHYDGMDMRPGRQIDLQFDDTERPASLGGQQADLLAGRVYRAVPRGDFTIAADHSSHDVELGNAAVEPIDRHSDDPVGDLRGGHSAVSPTRRQFGHDDHGGLMNVHGGAVSSLDLQDYGDVRGQTYSRRAENPQGGRDVMMVNEEFGLSPLNVRGGGNHRDGVMVNYLPLESRRGPEGVDEEGERPSMSAIAAARNVGGGLLAAPNQQQQQLHLIQQPHQHQEQQHQQQQHQQLEDIDPESEEEEKEVELADLRASYQFL